jgi:hypothetical protein
LGGVQKTRAHLLYFQETSHMPPKQLTVGSRVKALARTVKSVPWARANAGGVDGVVRGEVTDEVGTGRSKKFVVRWEDGLALSTLSARSLELDNKSDPSSDNSDEDSDNSDEDSCGELVSSSDSDSDEEGSEEGSDEEESDKEDARLKPHGYEYKLAAAIPVNPVIAPPFKPTILVGLGGQHVTEADFFKLFFPMGFLQKMEEYTKTSWPASKGAAPTKEEIFKCFLLRLAMTLQPMPTARDYWRETDDGVFTPPKFRQRYGISRERFESIMENLKCFDGLPETLARDPWAPVRELITSFNTSRAETINPGFILVVDELMSAWRGREEKVHGAGLPHATKIPRKPEPIGTEVKCCADGLSGIMLRLELQEGKSRMQDLPLQKELGAGTAVTLRLTEPWWGSNRDVVGDSWFASVKTVKECAGRGLNFSGVVKTATREFPMKYLKEELEPKAEGSTVQVTHEENGAVTVIAMGWKTKHGNKYLAARRGTTLPADPFVVTRYKVNRDTGLVEKRQRSTARNQLLANYFDHAAAIDIHNHLRQGGLGLEKSWISQDWVKRILATLLGIIEVDAFLAFSYFRASQCSHANFTSAVVSQLLRATPGQPVEAPRGDDVIHKLVRVATLSPKKRKLEAAAADPERNAKNARARVRCRECKQKCAYVCEHCNAEVRRLKGEGHYYGLCAATSECYQKHLQRHTA